jgi:hypothetical protein
MFLAAVLHNNGGSLPVKIRNMSATGVMLEAPDMPPVGEPVRLVRGSLAVRGEVVWTAGIRCGVRLATAVQVAQWLVPLLNQEQQRIDDTVALIKAGAVPLRLPARTGALPGAMEGQAAHRGSDAQLAADLTQVIALLEDLGARLASDRAVVERHGIELQNIDIGVQTLSEIIRAMSPGDSPRSDRAPARR